jgi:hypothetical protein
MLQKHTVLALLLVSSNSFAAKPPPDVIEQMEILASVEAAVRICTDSNEYMKMPATEALKFNDISMKSGDIIDLIQKRFNDDLAYLAFITASIKISESPQFRSKFSKTYSKKCSAQLLTDSNQTINSVESRVRFLLRK